MAFGKTVATLKANVLQKLRQPALNYDRYTEANILDALNNANVAAASRLKCIHSYAIIMIRAGYSQYKAPNDMLAPKGALFYQSSTSYVDLTKNGWKSRDWLDKFVPGWRVMSGDPLYAFIGDNIGNTRKIGFTPTPDTDGDDYLSSPDTGIVVSTTGMTTTGNITGTCSADDATTCTDSAGRTLSDLGVQVGMMAFNITDGSKGQISAVSGSTFDVTLAGGTADAWTTGDSFTILAGEYGVVVDVDGTESYLFSSDIGELVAISEITGNVYLEYYRMPLELLYDTQYPEIPRELHKALPDYAVWELKRTSPKGSDDYQEAIAAYQAFEKEIGSYQTVDQATEDNFIRFTW